MTRNARAIWGLVVACLIAATAVVVAAAEPSSGWEWVKLIAGILGAVGVAIRQTWADYPGAGLEDKA